MSAARLHGRGLSAAGLRYPLRPPNAALHARYDEIKRLGSFLVRTLNRN